MSLRAHSMLAGAAALAFLLSGCAAVVVGGVAATAVAISERRSLGNQIDDQAIESTFKRQLSRLEETLPGARVKAVAHNGVLLLVGEARDGAQRDRIGELGAAIGGVRRVVNELALTDPASPWRRARDTTLTARAKGALMDLGMPGFDATKVNVTAVRGEVYLMGLASRREADAVVAAVRDLRGVRRVVKVFEYLD